MKISYRGHEITAERDMSLGGDEYVYYSIFRESDLYECESNFTSGSEKVRDFIKHLKERVDAELREADPWMEKSQIK